MIRFEDYSFFYETEKERQGVRNINLHIEPGSCVLFCGSSGCGKSTLLKSVNGLIPHLTEGKYRGAVYIKNRAVNTLPMYELSKLAASVFQNPKSQFFNTDVESEIVYSLENRGCPVSEADARLKRTLQELRLEHLRGRSMFALSGGEKQQVAFAGAFISDAPVILLDEPTANLDMEAIVKIRNILFEMKKRGKTILVVEHRLHWLRGLVDTVYYMENGTIICRRNGETFFSMEDEERKKLGLRELYSVSDITVEYSNEPLGKSSILEVKELTLAYKKKVVQRELFFSLAAGEILGIIGANGAGKTTLLRTLAGLKRVTHGAVLLNGKIIKERERRKRFGMVMQDVNYQLFSDSCENECRLGNPGVDEETAKELLSEVGLSSVSDRHPQCLSGGQKQRLALAVCKASDKDILLLDEPTGGLDYAGMIAVRNVLNFLSAKGKSVVVVTHDMEFIRTVCNRIILLERTLPGSESNKEGCNSSNNDISSFSQSGTEFRE